MNFELETYTNKNGIIEIKNYDELYDSIKDLLDNEIVSIISDGDERKEAYKRRTELNKLKEVIDRRRIDTTKEVLGLFNDELKELAELVDSKSKEYSEEIKNYDAKTKVLAPKKITATLKFSDEKVIDELIEFAKNNNCELTIK